MEAIKIEKPVQLRDQVYNRVKRALLEGFYQQGERVTEGSVAKHLGVSRTPVREALRMLEELGFLDSRDSGGYCVPLLNEKNIGDLIDVRLLLESRTMQLAVKNGTQEELQTLHAALNDVKSSTLGSDSIDLYLSLQPFWSAFWAMSHSAGLNACLSNLTEQYHYQYLSAIALADEGVEAGLVEFLEQIYDSLSSRDAKEGVKLVKVHLTFKKAALLNVVKRLSNS
ncbi:MAG: DNA-binding GntR family transcriptional regulator [Halioglobus sp.]|jgi:DNA-binding GntR family transcriptional regulator